MERLFSEQNQDMLWATFQKIPETKRLSYDAQCKVFQSALHIMYQQISVSANPSVQEIQSANRHILQQLYESLKTHMSQYSTSSFVETEQERTERIFKEKNDVYKKMTEKPNIETPIELQHEQADMAIQNMDEVIEKYQEERILEMPPLAPIVPPEDPVPEQTILEKFENKIELMGKNIEDIRSILESLEKKLEKKIE